MTCREKLALERPDKISPGSPGGCYACPISYGYLERPDYCTDASNVHGDRCDECWNREIPEEGDIMIGDKLYHKDDIPICNELKDTGIDTPEKLHSAMDILRNEPRIKDSGDRTEFATGAVRDMREGKGRCDLMPLVVVAELLRTSITDADPYISRIKLFQNTGKTLYLKSCLIDFATLAPAFKDMPTMLLEVAKHFEEGAKKYGENNWQKGIPVHCYIDSAVRHYLKWLRGDKDEPHDRAFVWNLMCCIWEVDYREKNDG